MEDELHKRHTDCAYFLASPLTCKKGIECEFRHSEMARLNPRDCRYWLGGNCFNPTCGFRHRPLEGEPGNSSEPASLPPQVSVPVSKKNVPCYFYFSGFCNKGDNCSFLHGPKNNEGMQASVEPPCNQLENTTKDSESIQFDSKAEHFPLVSDNMLQQSPSSQTRHHEHEEAVVKSEHLAPADDNPSLGVNQTSPSADQSAEAPSDTCQDPEEPCDSSPGFDVLVDDGSEKLSYEDAQEYLLAHKDDMALHERLFGYDYDNSMGYLPEYAETGLLYENGLHELYDSPDEGYVSDHGRRVPKRSGEMMLNPLGHSKKRQLPREEDFSERNGSDLRNHLRNRRRITSRWGEERPGRRHNHEQSQRRPTSVRSSNRNGESSEDDIPRHGHSRPALPRYSRSRKQDRERRRQARHQFISTEISSGDMASRDKHRSSQESSAAFTGPKTLAQIKAEKRKDMENREF